MRRLSLVALTVGIALAIAAAALAGPKDPRVHPRAADVKLAKKLVMNRSDLPAGFVDKGPKKQSSGSTGNVPCSLPNLHALVETARVHSHDFVRSRKGSFAEASSDADFFLRPAQATKVVSVAMGSTFGSCLKRVVTKSVSKSGKAKIVSAHLTPLSENVRDLHARIWDMLVTFKEQGHRFRDELVIAFLRRGRVVSSLFLNSLNGVTETEASHISAALTLRLESLPRTAVR